MKLRFPILPFMLATLVACDGDVNRPAVEFRIPVEVEEVGTSAVEDLIATTGTLRPRESVILTIETPGALHLARDSKGDRLVEGSSVVKGQLIAEVTGEDARLATRIESTARHLESAKQDVERKEQLYKQKLVAEDDVYQAKTRYEDALHDYDSSRRTLEKSRVSTPIAGVLLELARDARGQAVADGQLVSPGFGVARIAPLDRLIADIDLVGPELSRVHPGQAVRIRHYAFKGLEIAGTVLRLSPSIDPTTRTFRVEVEVDNSTGELRPGMFVQASIVAERHEDVVVIPRDAMTQRSGKNVVFVLDGQRAVQRDIALGLSDDRRFEVINGLAANERIVVRGLETLTDGTRVRVVNP
jgi:membrane fusion protein, multidrug efflux system